MPSLGQIAVILAGVMLLVVGLVLWRLEVRNPRLLNRFESPGYRRWALPSTLLVVLAASAVAFVLPYPWGALNRDPLLLGIVWALLLLVIAGWLKTHPNPGPTRAQ